MIFKAYATGSCVKALLELELLTRLFRALNYSQLERKSFFYYFVEDLIKSWVLFFFLLLLFFFFEQLSPIAVGPSDASPSASPSAFP